LFIIFVRIIAVYLSEQKQTTTSTQVVKATQLFKSNLQALFLLYLISNGQQVLSKLAESCLTKYIPSSNSN